MKNYTRLTMGFLFLGFAAISNADTSLACTGEKYIGDGDPSKLTFTLGANTQGSQVSPNQSLVELKLPSLEAAEAKVQSSTVSFVASFNPVNGDYDVDVYDSKVVVPGDAKPRVFRVGGANDGDNTTKVRFEYEQWGALPTVEGQKRVSTLYVFECTVAKYPQYKF